MSRPVDNLDMTAPIPMSAASVPAAKPTRFVVTSDGELLGEDTPENREQARRLRACVNACEGLSTDDLEAGIVTQMLEIVRSVGPLLKPADDSGRRAA